jgi:hypothetical protein
MATITKNCECCGKPMQVRSADVKRGWGKFCSKTCKARRQEQRTGQYSRLLSGAMSPADLALGGYGDSGRDDDFGGDKW